MAIETNVATEWLVTRLKSRPALIALVGSRISDWPGPQGTVGPYVVFHLQTAMDTYVVGNRVVFVDAQYLVAGVMQTRSYFGPLATIANEIHAALQDQGGVTTDGTVITCRRERIHQEVDPDEPSWRYYGGLYRLLPQVQ